MAGSHSQLEAYRRLKAQRRKRAPRVPVAPRAPGPEEEDPRVKCRDCGAFGHKASSTRCPMKHWGRALAPQALGSRKPKENVEPRSQQDQQNPGPMKPAARDMAEGPRRVAQQRETLVQRFPRRPQEGQKPTWKDGTESCGYVRRPNRPMPVYSTRRASVLETPLPWAPPTRTADRRATDHSASALRSPAGSVVPPGARQEAWRGGTPAEPHLACQTLAREGGLLVLRENRPRGDSPDIPRAASQLQGVGRAQALAKCPENSRPTSRPGTVRTSQMPLTTADKRWTETPLETDLNPRKKARWSPLQQHHKSPQEGHLGAPESLRPPPARTGAWGPPAAPKLTGKTPAPVQGTELRPARPRPLLETVRPCTEAPHPPSKPAPARPLRMVFTRLDEACWSSRFPANPSFRPPQKPAPPGQGPPAIRKSQAPFGHSPVSVLYEDLQVSSSSDDSGTE